MTANTMRAIAQCVEEDTVKLAKALKKARRHLKSIKLFLQAMENSMDVKGRDNGQEITRSFNDRYAGKT